MSIRQFWLAMNSWCVGRLWRPTNQEAPSITAVFSVVGVSPPSVTPQSGWKAISVLGKNSLPPSPLSGCGGHGSRQGESLSLFWWGFTGNHEWLGARGRASVWYRSGFIPNGGDPARSLQASLISALVHERACGGWGSDHNCNWSICPTFISVIFADLVRHQHLQ